MAKPKATWFESINAFISPTACEQPHISLRVYEWVWLEDTIAPGPAGDNVTPKLFFTAFLKS